MQASSGSGKKTSKKKKKGKAKSGVKIPTVDLSDLDNPSIFPDTHSHYKMASIGSVFTFFCRKFKGQGLSKSDLQTKFSLVYQGTGYFQAVQDHFHLKK